MKRLIFIFTLIIISIISGCKRFPDLGSGYQLNYNGMNDISIINCLKEGDAPTIFIYGHILDYAFDSTFIIVSERPIDSVIGIETMTQSKYQEVFEQSEFKQYWIINKAQNSVFSQMTKKYSNIYGPYSKEKYIEKREELGVSEELKLEFEY